MKHLHTFISGIEITFVKQLHIINYLLERLLHLSTNQMEIGKTVVAVYFPASQLAVIPNSLWVNRKLSSA